MVQVQKSSVKEQFFRHPPKKFKQHQETALKQDQVSQKQLNYFQYFSFQKVNDVVLFPKGSSALFCHISQDGKYIFVQGDINKLKIYSVFQKQSKLIITSIGYLSVKESIKVIVTCSKIGPIVIHWYSDINWKIIRRQTIQKNYHLQFVSNINNLNLFACNILLTQGCDNGSNIHIYKLLNKTTHGTQKVQTINGGNDFLFPCFCLSQNVLIALIDDQGLQNNSIVVFLFNPYFSEYRFHQRLRKHSFIDYLQVQGNQLFAFGNNKKLFIYQIQKLGCTNQEKECTSLRLQNYSNICIFPNGRQMICSAFFGNLSLWSKYEFVWEKDIEIRNKSKITGICISQTNKALIATSDGNIFIYQ